MAVRTLKHHVAMQHLFPWVTSLQLITPVLRTPDQGKGYPCSLNIQLILSSVQASVLSMPTFPNPQNKLLKAVFWCIFQNLPEITFSSFLLFFFFAITLWLHMLLPSTIKLLKKSQQNIPHSQLDPFHFPWEDRALKMIRGWFVVLKGVWMNHLYYHLALQKNRHPSKSNMCHTAPTMDCTI